MPPAIDRSRLQAVPMRWCNFIDILGFSQLWESDQSRALHALRELMGAIYRIGTRVYPHEVKRLFVHHLGDGFAIVSDFGEASLERPLGIAAALMRHVEEDAPDLLVIGPSPAVEAHASAPRSNSSAPRWLSSMRMRWATAGGVTPSSSPAWAKLRSRAAASKKRRQSRGGREITDSGAGNGGLGFR